jgi:hypothetical protein
VSVRQREPEELEQGNDELASWARARQPLFPEPDDASEASLRALSGWANNANYGRAAINDFLASGDYYLVAQSHAGRHTVVTHETPAPASKTRIMIPDACAALGVRCTGPFVMLRNEGARFVLA